MNIRQLKHAICLAEEQSFGRAAEKLHLTQSALSRSIQTLEGDLELTLFERHRTGARTTQEGELFLSRARDLVRQSNGLMRDAALIRGAQIGDIALGVGPAALHLLLPKILPKMMASHPRLNISVDVQPAVVLLQNLLDEKIEFFIADDQQFSDHPLVETIFLSELIIGFFVRRKHPIAERKHISIEQLQQYSLASPSFVNKTNAKGKTHIRPILEQQWAGHLSCEYADILVKTALHSDAVLLSPTGMVTHELERGDLIEIKAQKPFNRMRSNLKLVKLAGRRLSPASETLLGMIRTYILSTKK